MMVTAYDLLARAHELLQQGWGRDNFASNSEGEETHPEAEEARSFCLVGALYRAEFDLRRGEPDAAACARGKAALILADLLGTTRSSITLTGWNDEQETVGTVLAIVAQAAEKARVEGEK